MTRHLALAPALGAWLLALVPFGLALLVGGGVPR